jgi:hypothetical protein
MSIHDFFRDGKCDLPGLAQDLDSLAGARRIEQVRLLTAKEQELLWNAAEGTSPLALDHFVPSAVGPLQEVIHWGKNSLPLFSKFQKRFCRPPSDARTPDLWGYNEQPLKLFTGPGYFVCRATTAADLDQHGVVIDYTLQPGGKADGWPAFIPNDKRLSRFIYNGTRDYMRGVSRHVSIGRASRGKDWMPNWFVLCRAEEPAGGT